MSEEEAMRELAKAMSSLAERLEKFQDPLWWQVCSGRAMQTVTEHPALVQEMRLALPVSVQAVTVGLSDEDRKAMVETAYRALAPQIKEFGKFTKRALKDLPAFRLKEIVDKIEAGEMPKLRQRRGCIAITFDSGDDEIYLPL